LNLKENDMRIIKRNYVQPMIDCIKLDNQISLALESWPAAGPDEGFNSIPTPIKETPFKLTNG
jgi:hypothetical protein